MPPRRIVANLLRQTGRKPATSESVVGAMACTKHSRAELDVRTRRADWRDSGTPHCVGHLHEDEQMRVADLMQTDLFTVAPEARVAEVVQAMADGHVSGLPVVDPAGRLLGVVSATDILQAAAEHEGGRGRTTLFEHTTARDLMTPVPITIEPDADVREAARRMLYGEVRRLFVEDDGRLVGVISQTDIAHALGSGRL